MIFGVLEIARWIILLCALFASLYYWKGYNQTPQRYFPFFLLFTLLIELSATLSVYVLKEEAHIYYNIYLIGSVTFFLIWLRSILKKKGIVKIFIAIFLLSVIISAITTSIFDDVYAFSLITGSVLILIGAFLFFKELLLEEEVVDFLSNQQFWIMSGLLIFYIGFLPFYLLISYLNMRDYRFAIVVPFLNILLYGCFIIGFRCRTK